MTETKKILLEIVAFLTISFVIISCNEGLSPPPPVIPASLSGRIHYLNGANGWPAADSIKDIRLVAFKFYPPKDIFNEITNGNAFYTETLQFFVDSSEYKLIIQKPPVEIKYIVVAQQYGNLFQWRAIGVWTISGNKTKPSSISVKQGDSLINLNIDVDFQNLPPQPFN